MEMFQLLALRESFNEALISLEQVKRDARLLTAVSNHADDACRSITLVRMEVQHAIDTHPSVRR